jgi:hypothetical protein
MHIGIFTREQLFRRPAMSCRIHSSLVEALVKFSGGSMTILTHY